MRQVPLVVDNVILWKEAHHGVDIFQQFSISGYLMIGSYLTAPIVAS